MRRGRVTFAKARIGKSSSLDGGDRVIVFRVEKLRTGGRARRTGKFKSRNGHRIDATTSGSVSGFNPTRDDRMGALGFRSVHPAACGEAANARVEVVGALGFVPYTLRLAAKR
jgi:hypothetical protein